MPRQARKESGTGIFHVMMRGINRKRPTPTDMRKGREGLAGVVREKMQRAKMKKKHEYTHEDMERLGEEIELLRLRARQVDQDIRSGAISHEQWESAAQILG